MIVLRNESLLFDLRPRIDSRNDVVVGCRLCLVMVIGMRDETHTHNASGLLWTRVVFHDDLLWL